MESFGTLENLVLVARSDILMTRVIHINEKTILLTFPDKEITEYVRLVCRRKGIDLAAYIVDNFEWDDKPDCILNPNEKITSETCLGCEYSESCPDVKREKVHR